jgi:hypothetical protein
VTDRRWALPRKRRVGRNGPRTVGLRLGRRGRQGKHRHNDGDHPPSRTSKGATGPVEHPNLLEDGDRSCDRHIPGKDPIATHEIRSPLRQAERKHAAERDAANSV